MPDQPKSALRLEIAHVLFIDIVGYSKLLNRHFDRPDKTPLNREVNTPEGQ